MFHSFFPKPRWFFPSAILWIGLNIALWYCGGESAGEWFGWPQGYADKPLTIGLSRFWSPAFLWFYLWFLLATIIFAVFWSVVAKHPWQRWSIWGSALILFNIWFSVQINVTINAWYGPFWDMIQKMLSSGGGSISDLYQNILTFLQIAMVAVTVFVLNTFFVSHYVFRWRTAMNYYYIENWSTLRTVEGASQRVQEDTMRFATIVEELSVSLVRAVMVLIAFLPLLFQLSSHVPALPIIGEVKYSLVWAALGWSLFGTVLLVAVGIKLPGLQFNIQKVEAAYRKELVYGEDDSERAQPATLKELFERVKVNYYRLYFHYAYFNMVSIWYLQLDGIYGLVMLFPSIAAGTMTLGLINQILNVFNNVRESFQYLINSWKTIIELLSIHKRLKAFESILNDKN
ncbi:peptide antibiotic transporter SbmA [Snodgrassella alvi]|uniref:peptide antibiotic transporter SbmA n=1 Tax=Snodgrassella alvi TaxID=1196083 RepID=UPI00352F9297